MVEIDQKDQRSRSPSPAWVEIDRAEESKTDGVDQDQYVREADRLKDPLGDRRVNSEPRPPARQLSRERVFPSDGGDIDPNLIKAYLEQGGALSKDCLLELVSRAKRVMDAEPNLLRVQGKVIIVGDIHGQFYDLIWMLRKTWNKLGQGCKLLFLGDYVDRGLFGVEVIAYLFALKVSNP